MPSDIPALTAEQFTTLLVEMSAIRREARSEDDYREPWQAAYARGLYAGATACLVQAAIIADLSSADVIDGALEAHLAADRSDATVETGADR